MELKSKWGNFLEGKKRTIISISIIFVILVSMTAIYLYDMKHGDVEVDRGATELLDNYGESKGQAAEATELSEWNDKKIQDVLHKMTHQKVVAKEKWGAIEMTEEHIKTVSEIVEQNKNTLHSYNAYRKVLDKWLKGDFEAIDDDHNAIWSLQGGTVGEALGIASKQEEAEFIKMQFGEGE